MGEYKSAIQWPVQIIQTGYLNIKKTSKCSPIIISDDYIVIDKCVFCEKSFYPPKAQCPEDHRVCGECINFVRNCPICTGLIVNTDLIITARNCHNLYPCWYIFKGCQEYGSKDIMEEHHKHCLYGLVDCPFKFQNCRWRGTDLNIFTHLFEDHNLENNDKQLYFFHNSRHDLFKLTYNEMEGKHNSGVTFNLSYIGEKCKANRFHYKIKVKKLENKSSSLLYDGVCQSASDSTLTVRDNIFVAFPTAEEYYFNKTFVIDIKLTKNRRNTTIGDNQPDNLMFYFPNRTPGNHF